MTPSERLDRNGLLYIPDSIDPPLYLPGEWSDPEHMSDFLERLQAALDQPVFPGDDSFMPVVLRDSGVAS